jgi:hypothetical protein
MFTENLAEGYDENFEVRERMQKVKEEPQRDRK